MQEELLKVSTWSLGTWIGVVSAVIGIILAVVSTIVGIVYPEQFKKAYFWALSVISRLASRIVTAPERKRLLGRIGELEGQLERTIAERDSATTRCAQMETESIRYVKTTDGRWNKIPNVTYGYLDFEPFVDKQPNGPGGPGVELLRFLLKEMCDPSIELIDHDETLDWATIFEGLRNGTYRIVATPLFATFERSKLVRFTSPLFYSNIGLYVSADLKKTRFKNSRMTSEDFNDYMRTASGLRLLSIDAEISQTLAKKYLDGNPDKEKLIVNHKSKTAPHSLFNTIFTGEDRNGVSGPFGMFCDSFYASIQPRVRSGEVVNLLLEREILYPVCYAVRLGDYQLANLINLRLLQFPKYDPKKENQSILEFTADLVAGLPRYKEFNLVASDVMRHFVDEWPSPSNQEARN
jgi:hypothetical protein